MARKSHQQVHTRLTEWADSAPPLPTPALAQFMGPARPRPGVGSSRAVRNAVRTGLGIKVFGLLAAMAATGAAAVGVSQVAQHEPEPPKTVVVPAVPSAVPDSPTSGPDDDPSTTAPATRPRPHVTPTASPTPRVHRPHPAGPAPSPRPSSHESEAPDPPAPEASDQPGPTTDAADTRSVESAPAD